MRDIDAGPKTIRGLLQGVKYSIDYYQREYKWRQKEILELLEDLEGKFSESYDHSHVQGQVAQYTPYFLGSIVISEKANGEKFIIDGQQRLTSLTLLLIYIHNQLPDNSDDRNDISNLIFSTSYGSKSFNLNVPERIACFNALYSNIHTFFDSINESESVKTIIDRYQDIESHFPESLKNEVLPYFADWLKERVMMVQITTFSDDDAYTIFETMNDRGLSLNQSEMLKGYLLSKIVDDSKKEQANQIWKKRVMELIRIGKEEEIDFIKSWLRSQYANSIRKRDRGANPKDFEKIGTEFHKWVRDNKSNLGLNRSDDFYNFVMNHYTKYSDYYIMIRNACDQFTPEFETMYFNAHNNFTLQYPVLLAPLKHNDELETINKKIRIVGRYLDIMIARRFVNFRILSYSGLVYTMFNLIKEIRQKEPEELVKILSARLDNMEETFAGVEHLYIHQQNRRHIHYLLARMTYHIEEKSGINSNFIKYIAKNVKKPYEIEHLWADKYERHSDEFEDSNEFAQRRNFFGGLILLPRGFNQSLNDDSYINKVEHYIRDNLLAQSLHPKCYERNPSFLRYIGENRLPFEPYSDFKKDDLTKRQNLYWMLCEEIWNPKRLQEELEK